MGESMSVGLILPNADVVHHQNQLKIFIDSLIFWIVLAAGVNLKSLEQEPNGN